MFDLRVFRSKSTACLLVVMQVKNSSINGITKKILGIPVSVMSKKSLENESEMNFSIIYYKYTI